MVLVGAQVDFPPKAYAAQVNGKMLETTGNGYAYYFDGTSLHICSGVKDCQKIK